MPGCDQMVLVTGALVKWLLQRQEAVWMGGHGGSGILHHPPFVDAKWNQCLALLGNWGRMGSAEPSG